MSAKRVSTARLAAVAKALRAVSRLTETPLETEPNKLARGGLRTDAKPKR